MTPYELRFQIFQQAVGLADMEYQSQYGAASMWNENNPVKVDYPTFPSYEYIEELANKINTFVSSK